VFTGVPNGTYAYTIGTVANYTLTGSYPGTVTVAGLGHGTIAATVATHWTLVTYSVKFTETGLPPGTSWELTIDGKTKVSTAKGLSFLISNGTYSFTATSSGYTPVTGTVTVDGSNVTETVTFT
jgi:hypothetical protein